MRAARDVFLAVAAGALLAGCGPMSDEEQEYLDLRAADAEQRAAFSQALRGGEEESEAIRLVKESAAEDEQGTTEEWVERRLAEVKGQVLFARWNARRRGAGKYEVRFTYTVLGDDQSIERQGLQWDVDLVLEVASAPRPMTAAELTPPGAPPPAQRRQAAARDDFSLE
ncbi:MAG: hypothetical protein JXB04_04115 [Kiritimatiellae bacterium]|nr:hypothetical protein [Kiritimatiellia bacterium]